MHAPRSSCLGLKGDVQRPYGLMLLGLKGDASSHIAVRNFDLLWPAPGLLGNKH